MSSEASPLSNALPTDWLATHDRSVSVDRVNVNKEVHSTLLKQKLAPGKYLAVLRPPGTRSLPGAFFVFWLTRWKAVLRSSSLQPDSPSSHLPSSENAVQRPAESPTYGDDVKNGSPSKSLPIARKIRHVSLIATTKTHSPAAFSHALTELRSRVTP